MMEEKKKWAQESSSGFNRNICVTSGGNSPPNVRLRDRLSPDPEETLSTFCVNVNMFEAGQLAAESGVRGAGMFLCPRVGPVYFRSVPLTAVGAGSCNKERRSLAPDPCEVSSHTSYPPSDGRAGLFSPLPFICTVPPSDDSPRPMHASRTFIHASDRRSVCVHMRIYQTGIAARRV